MNDRFREHVTGQAFVMSLGKTHVRALLALQSTQNAEWKGADRSGWDVTPVDGLIRRGLVDHHYPPLCWPLTSADWSEASGSTRDYVLAEHERTVTVGDYYRLTLAGSLVTRLLAEAGYSEATPDD